jgi:hypothetical protein
VHVTDIEQPVCASVANQHHHDEFHPQGILPAASFELSKDRVEEFVVDLLTGIIVGRLVVKGQSRTDV